MIQYANQLHRHRTNCEFTSNRGHLKSVDYTIASGIFNVKLDVSGEQWLDYVLETLENMARLSHCGFAFNALTSYADSDRMRPDLYDADPMFLFDHCVRTFSRHVSVLHD